MSADHLPDIVKVDADSLKKETEDHIVVEAGGIRIRVTNKTPMDLIIETLRVVIKEEYI